MHWLLMVSGLLLLSACSRSPHGRAVLTLRGPDGNTVLVHVDIAATEQERERGLMGLEHLDADSGMLFQFQEPAIQDFWMKNTLIPLDILFFDASGALVSMEKMIPCATDPCPVYASKEPALSALEVPGGFIEQYGIKREWRMETVARDSEPTQ